MSSFDRRLVRPSVFQLVEALEQASLKTGGKQSGWQAFVEGIRGEREGFRQWTGAGVVSVAWWTDASSRRHFRIQACSENDRAFSLVYWDEAVWRPPLWHLYPDHVFGREIGGCKDWLGVCNCQTCALVDRPGGWMGQHCWRCRDLFGTLADQRPQGPGAFLYQEDVPGIPH